MTKPKKRLSAGMALPPDGVDPLFEFDVARLFVDLTAATSAQAIAASGHDAWFDFVHDDHSRPTDEFAALSSEETQQRRKHGEEQASTAGHSSTTTTTTTTTATMISRAKEIDADVEKENRNARATVGRSRGAGLGGAAVRTGPAGRARLTAPTATAPRVAGLKRPLAGRSMPLGQLAQSSTNTSTGNTMRSANSSSHSTVPKKRSVSERSAAYRPTASSTSKSTSTTKPPSSSSSDLQELQALLAKHNKKFKSAHTYEPRQHSVRDVRTWEQQTNKSYYTLSSDERLQANEEIAALVRRRLEVSGAT
ncbi:hypothetical protein ATCC90586_004243 [Pythium insidiosum]|nr:hypothetical protein ATCC90586_004243 [Pythium insidiosum]